MRIGMMGDVHGNTAWTVESIAAFARNKINTVIQLGDLGFWPTLGGVKYLDAVQEVCHKHGIMLFAVMGNHDWNSEWTRLLSTGPWHHDTRGVYVRSNIVLLPRTGRFPLGGREFAVAGGAVSIDRRARIEGRDWWSEETLTWYEVESFSYGVGCDVLLTHDASSRIPMSNHLIPHEASMQNRKMIDFILEQTQPTLHFHGHYHRWYDWQNTLDTGKKVQTYGLDMDGTRKNKGILNTHKMEFDLIEH